MLMQVTVPELGPKGKASTWGVSVLLVALFCITAELGSNYSASKRLEE